MGVSKVVYGNQTLIDLSQDTVEANKIRYGYTAHKADGTQIVGSYVPPVYDIFFTPEGLDPVNKTWTDAMQGITLNLNDACSIQDGHLVINGKARLQIPVTQSSYLAMVRASIPTSFTPPSTWRWYNCACIVGNETSGTVQDGGLILNGSGYLAIGNGNTTISCDNDVEGRSNTEVPYMFIADHQGNRSNYAGFIRGNLTEVETSALRSGGFSNKLGVFWNTSSEDSHITQGTISEIGIKYLPLDWAIT